MMFLFFFTVGYTQAYDKLVPARPAGSLVKPANILSILLQVLCAAVFQTAAILYLRGQFWWVEVVEFLAEILKLIISLCKWLRIK